MAENAMVIQEVGMTGEKIRVIEVVHIPEEEMNMLYERQDTENYDFVNLLNDGYSAGYEREFLIAKKKDTEAHYRFMAINYAGLRTYTRPIRVFSVETTYTRTSYTTILDKKEHADIIRTLPVK